MKIEQLNRFLLPIKRRISVLVLKALISKATDLKNKVQRVRVDSGNNQVSSNIERIQPFGLSTNPDDGAEGIVLSIGGNREHQIVISVDDSRYRVKVSKGNVALYNKSGMVIELRDEEILLGKGIQNKLTDLDGIVTGQSVDTLTGIKLGLLPGNNSNGLANSLKLKAEL